MEETSLKKLMNRVIYTGFPENLEGQIREHIKAGHDKFSLEHVGFSGKDTARATLDFSKSKKSDDYYFNHYELELKKAGQEAGLKHKFHIGSDNNITFREGVNLLAGRSVLKNLRRVIDTGTDGTRRLEPRGEKYEAWLRLDTTDTDKNGAYLMRQYHQAYGFNLEQALAKHPIKELSDQTQKDELMRTLQKGNVAMVTFVIAGKEEKRYIEASPQFKSINQYDLDMARTGFRKNKTVEEKSQGQAEQQSEKTGQARQKQDQNGADAPVQQQRKRASRKRGVSVA